MGCAAMFAGQPPPSHTIFSCPDFSLPRPPALTWCSRNMMERFSQNSSSCSMHRMNPLACGISGKARKKRQPPSCRRTGQKKRLPLRCRWQMLDALGKAQNNKAKCQLLAAFGCETHISGLEYAQLQTGRNPARCMRLQAFERNQDKQNRLRACLEIPMNRGMPAPLPAPYI